MSTLLLSLPFAIIATFIGLYFKTRNQPSKLPPGPKGWPLIGNALQIPFGRTWLKFDEWAKDYGPIYTLYIFSKPIVVCTASKTAADILEKRSASFSDRPRFVVGGEILSKGMHAGLVNYGALHRKHRRVLNETLKLKAVQKYDTIQQQETTVLLRGLLANPGGYEDHAKRFAASVIMTTTYDHPVGSLSDPIVKRIYKQASRFANTLAPGAYLAEALPWLNYFPKWLPGMKWKREAMQWAEEDMALYNEMVDIAKSSKQRNGSAESFVAHMFDNMDKYDLARDEAAYLAGVLFAAATETVASAMCVFILMMTRFPEIQAIARAEVDAVIGPNRMPVLADTVPEKMPYLNALMKEILRFRPPAPLAVPHASIQDEVYNGYLIPKGTTVIGSVWSIHHDPELYPDPTAFRPERFLGPEGRALPYFTFGFGRRACPGLHLAYSSLLIFMAGTLWGFDITPANDADGKPVFPDISAMAFTEGGEASRPYPFECGITPRSKLVPELLSQCD